MPVDNSLDGGRSRSVTRSDRFWFPQINDVATARASVHRPEHEEDDATDENGRQDESARDIASSDMLRSRLPSDQAKGQDAPYSTDMMTVPDSGVKRTSDLQPAGVCEASRTIVPSSRGEPTSTVQSTPVRAARIASMACCGVLFSANDPLVGPAPVSAGSWPGNVGNEAGSESKIVPKSVSVVVGGPTVALTTGLAGPPGTAVSDGATAVREDVLGLGLEVAAALEPQPIASTASATARIGNRGLAARRRSAITGSS